MSLGRNLQFLRRMRDGMTQEELAERMGVSRQTVSKWETDQAYPEIDKLVELCALFSCTLDQLVREDMTIADEEYYSDIRVEQVEGFRYIRYAVISAEPEEDAIEHVRRWAAKLGIESPTVIGWDFPALSQEQINVYNMHGYAAALVLPEGMAVSMPGAEVVHQEAQKYAVITIRRPSVAPFQIIPGAYKILLRYLQANGSAEPREWACLPCFEREYIADGIDYMDVYVAAGEENGARERRFQRNSPSEN